MPIDLHFDEEDWRRIRRDWTAWWNHESPRPMVMVWSTDLCAADLPEVPIFTSNLPIEMPADEVIDRCQAHLAQTRCHGDAWPRWWPNFGPGVMAAFFGSHLTSRPDTVWFEPRPDNDIQNLQITWHDDNPWLGRIEELTRAAVARWGDQVQVGHSDLGGNLDILASLRGSEALLMDLYDCPEQVVRLVPAITDEWCRCYDRFAGLMQPRVTGLGGWWPLWTGGSSYMLQCDFSYMISPDMFRRFVLCDLAACCDHVEYPFYHLDGKGEIPHLDHLLSLDQLRGIQWVPGDGAPPAQEWLELLRRIVDAGKLCQVPVSAEGALKIARVLDASKFAFHIMDPLSAEDTRSLGQALTE